MKKLIIICFCCFIWYSCGPSRERIEMDYLFGRVGVPIGHKSFCDSVVCSGLYESGAVSLQYTFRKGNIPNKFIIEGTATTRSKESANYMKMRLVLAGKGKTIKYAELSPRPKKIIAIGIQAIGGIGLNNSIIGLTMFFAVLDNAVNNPKHIEIMAAIRNPIKTLFKLERVWTNNSPLRIKLTNRINNSLGGGIILLDILKIK